MRFHYLCTSLTERKFRLPHPLVIESVGIKRKSLLKNRDFLLNANTFITWINENDVGKPRMRNERLEVSETFAEPLG